VSRALPEEFPPIRQVAEAVGALVLLVTVLLFVSVLVPQLALADHSYVVQTDSMSPAIGAGSVVYVSEVEPDSVDVGDVITFTTGGAAGSSRVTHRVVDVQESDDSVRFRTKGDANEEADPGTIPSADVVGVVTFHVPYIGYVVAFAGTGTGAFLLVAVPGLILLLLEARDLHREMTADGSEPALSSDPASAESDREVTDGGE